jgi:transcriptional regulator with XRE-family HTH domain
MASSIRVRLGRRLSALREERGWNQSYLAEISGIGRSHLSQIENGAVAVRIDTLHVLAMSLGIKLSKLLEDF